MSEHNISIGLDHIGWVTDDLEKFEEFWVKGLGFKRVWESTLSKEKTRILFGLDGGASCYRYKWAHPIHESEDITIEIHQFSYGSDECSKRFNRFGINHISLVVYDMSRDEFIERLTNTIGPFSVSRIRDPRGWDNIFIRDFEGNWIELREKM